MHFCLNKHECFLLFFELPIEIREEPTMKLTQLKYFKTVAELGKIMLAAETLYISPPALSATIASLEKELGVTLFDRSSNRIVLNEQGKIFLRYVNQIFNNLDCAKLELQQSLKNTEKNIHIAMTTSSIWIPLISGFALDFPQIMLSCSTLRISQLHNANLSRLYAFILAERNDFFSTELESTCLFEERPIAIVPESHPLAQKEVLELTDMAGEILFLPMADQSLNKRIKELFYSNQIPLKHTHECADAICKSMVLEGRGISFSTTRNGRTLPNGPQRYIPIHAPNCTWEQHLYWNKNRPLSPEENIFKNFVLEMYQQNIL